MLSVFQSIEWSWAGQMLKNSPWAFAVIESIHLLALATIGGAVLLVDMRLLGLGLRQQTVRDVARYAQPILVSSLIVLLLTGFGLFVSEAIKCYYSTPFWIKMTSLALAMLFTFTIKRKATLTGTGTAGPAMLRVVALVSLVLWFGVAASGRWIGFSG